MKTYEPHPLATIFPLVEGPPLWELSNDIKENGQQEPIWLLDDQVLDGRRRQLACVRAEVEPKYKQWKGKDPLAFVVSKNLHRRHLGEADRAIIAAKIATMKKTDTLKKGQNPNDSSDPPFGGSGISQEKAAKLMNVSTKAVERAAAVEKNGTPELKEALSQGTVSLADAATVAKEEPKTQRAAVSAVQSGKAKTATAAVKPKSGKPLFDDRPIEKTIGTLVRLFDSRANALGKCKEHNACIDAMEEVLDSWKKWQAKK
jgi:hypothetical protein